jgi:hypothetical protein
MLIAGAAVFQHRFTAIQPGEGTTQLLALAIAVQSKEGAKRALQLNGSVVAQWLMVGVQELSDEHRRRINADKYAGHSEQAAILGEDVAAELVGSHHIQPPGPKVRAGWHVLCTLHGVLCALAGAHCLPIALTV